MFELSKLFDKAKDKRFKDAIAELLKISPEKLADFEKAYQAAALDEEAVSDNFFDINSRQASESAKNISDDTSTYNKEEISRLIDRIVDELVSQTSVISVRDEESRLIEMPLLPDGSAMISNEDLNNIPISIRPQATGQLMKVDINAMSYKELFGELLDYQKTGNITHYNFFRQGLDILDLDEIVYAMLGQNQNSMGHWLPAVADAVKKHGFFRIPNTKIAKVPMPLLQLSRLDYFSINATTREIINKWAMKVFDLDVSKTYFIKTGTYSSKFDFRNAKVYSEKEVREIGEYLLFIQNQASQMASPLSRPIIYGVSTTNEWVVRDFIDDIENNPCIYKGMPLHTEYRVFVDFDTDEILGISPYWEPEMMKNRFSMQDDASSPHQKHDYVIFKMHEDTLMKRYNDNKDNILLHIKELLPDVKLTGQWSIDIMQNGDTFWLIDMATASSSALRECVPSEKLRVSAENWIPTLQQ